MIKVDFQDTAPRDEQLDWDRMWFQDPGHESLERLRLEQKLLEQFRENFPWTAKDHNLRQLGTIKVPETKFSGLAVPSNAQP